MMIKSLFPNKEHLIEVESNNLQIRKNHFECRFDNFSLVNVPILKSVDHSFLIKIFIKQSILFITSNSIQQRIGNVD